MSRGMFPSASWMLRILFNTKDSRIFQWRREEGRASYMYYANEKKLVARVGVGTWYVGGLPTEPFCIS